MDAYRVVTADPNVVLDLVLEAEYKIGRCLEKLERSSDALAQYHSKVVVEFLDENERGTGVSQDARKWFAMASLKAADIAESRQDWGVAVRILQRVLEAGSPVEEEEIRERIRWIKADHWRTFY